MTPKIVATKHANYVRPEWDGKPVEGEPMGEYVFVRPDPAAETVGATGKILLTETAKDNMTLASTTGILVAIGEDAWTWNTSRTKPFTARRPEVGDRVFYQRYSGVPVVDNDGTEYTAMSDTCICGVIRAKREAGAND